MVTRQSRSRPPRRLFTVPHLAFVLQGMVRLVKRIFFTELEDDLDDTARRGKIDGGRREGTSQRAAAKGRRPKAAARVEKEKRISLLGFDFETHKAPPPDERQYGEECSRGRPGRVKQ